MKVSRKSWSYRTSTRMTQTAQWRRVELTSLEQEINEDREANLERVTMHLERLLDKADKDHALLRHMDFHYRVRTMVCKARIR